MKRIFKSTVLFIAAFATILGGCSSPETSSAKKQYVVMLSMDGFRWDYASRVETTHLDQIAAAGVKAEYVKPVFPTKTFPNHYAMATGLYADHHGIVHNTFYCPEQEKMFTPSNRETVENGEFYHGEPIWVTAEKQGVRTASYFWVGSEADIGGVHPSVWKKYDGSVPFQARIDSVISWLNNPEDARPQLITFYFQEPDATGHRYGPDSKQIDSLVTELDALVGYLVEELEKLPFYDQINLIITSDHGMGETSSDRFVNLSQYIDKQHIEGIYGSSPVFHVDIVDHQSDSVVQSLEKADHVSVWRKNEIPERLNYGNNPRIADLVILADNSWSIGWEDISEENQIGGAHGWDNQWKDMHTIFYAMGPAFVTNHNHPPLEVVDLYPLIAEILNLKPANVDGRKERIENMLVKNK